MESDCFGSENMSKNLNKAMEASGATALEDDELKHDANHMGSVYCAADTHSRDEVKFNGNVVDREKQSLQQQTVRGSCKMCRDSSL